ncbi:MAG: bifunctional folylpolyglutamate synthase/dihydrofolate synthase [Ruminococcus sp.]|nr:bifunctional folylpolyglutamate synthase/dihydrofolate synthase [Ruminococcus sp.]
MAGRGFENAGDAVEFIGGFSHSGRPVSDLSRIKELLRAAGDPQDSLRFIHIAGTNGKGSAAEMFSCVMQRAGLRTGLFTSPFIIDYTDRIRINGRNIPPEKLALHAGRVRELLRDFPRAGELSQFEVTECIAFLYFQAEGCDIVVLETGLGGLLDCTNAVTTTVLSAIMSVDLDHTAILGSTVAEIAAQKAGIIKPGIPAVLSAGNDPEAVRVTVQAAERCKSRLMIPDVSRLDVISCGCIGTEFIYKGRRFSTSMGGRHQITNALTVIEGCEILGIDESAVAEGIRDASIPGRLTVLSRQPLTLLDGAHNPDAMRALAAAIRQEDTGDTGVIIGMCRDKSMAEALRELIPEAQEFVTTDGFSDRAEDREALAELIRSLGGRARAGGELAQEIAAMQQRRKTTVICGSLYLVTEVLNNNISGGS